MYATGVPAVISVSREVRKLQVAMQEMEKKYRNELAAMQQNIMDLIKEQPSIIIERVLERFEINGVVPVTRGDIRHCIDEVLGLEDGPLATVISLMKEQYQRVESIVCNQDRSDISPQESDLDCPGTLHYWKGDQKMHMVYEGFEFPSLYVVATMWRLWLFGDKSRGVCSFRNLSPKFELPRVNYSRCKKVMCTLIDIAKEGGIISSVRDITKRTTSRKYSIMHMYYY